MSDLEEIVMNSQMSDHERTLLLAFMEQCSRHGHCYHPTWEMGHFLCTCCGMRAVCSVCVPQWPDTKLTLHVCPKHQPKEEQR